MANITVEPRKDILKTLYRPVLAVSTIISGVVCFGFFSANPTLERTQEIRTRQAEQVEVVEIPPTEHEQQQVAPSRPQVPVEAEDEADIEDFTIEDTELFDEVELEVPSKIDDEVIVEEEEPVMELWLVEEQPRVMQQAVPEYPDIARQAGMEGNVTVTMVVGTDGHVEHVEVIAGPAVFHQAAIDAARRVVFTPARQNDRPVRVKVNQTIKFRLN